MQKQYLEAKRAGNKPAILANARRIQQLTGNYPKDFDSSMISELTMPTSPESPAEPRDTDGQGELDFGEPGGLDDGNGSSPLTRAQRELDQLEEERRRQQEEASRVTGTSPADASGRAPAPTGPGRPSATASTTPSSAQDDQEGEDNSERDASPTINPTEDKAKNKVAEQLEDWAKKRFVDPIKKNFSKEAWLALIKNPYFWIVIGVIVLLIIAIALFAYFSDQKGQNGKTPVQPISVISNKSSLEKLSILAGDKDAQKEVQKDVFQGADKDLLALKETTKDADTLASVNDTLTSVELYLTNNDPTVGQQAIDKIKKLLAKIDNFIPTMQGRYPVNPGDIVTFNNDLHMGTPLRPETIDPNLGHGTYMYPNENKCDAVDIYTKKDASIYPAFTGEVVDVSDDGTGNKKVVIKNGDYRMLYANIQPAVTVGDKITNLDKAIGKTVSIGGQYQVHLELSYCNACLVTTALDQIDKSSKNQATWGEYLWAHIKSTLKLQ